MNSEYSPTITIVFHVKGYGFIRVGGLSELSRNGLTPEAFVETDDPDFIKDVFELSEDNHQLVPMLLAKLNGYSLGITVEAIEIYQYYDMIGFSKEELAQKFLKDVKEKPYSVLQKKHTDWAEQVMKGSTVKEDLKDL